MSLFTPPDVKQCADLWQANCGPCALAAVLGLKVSAVREFFADFDKRQYVNPTHMKAALTAAKVQFSTVKQTPKRGLLFIQWGGFEKAPIAAQYRQTHWIAVNAGLVYEVNAGDDFEGAWVLAREWELVMPKMMLDVLPKQYNGQYSIRTAIQVGRETK